MFRRRWSFAYLQRKEDNKIELINHETVMQDRGAIQEGFVERNDARAGLFRGEKSSVIMSVPSEGEFLSAKWILI